MPKICYKSTNFQGKSRDMITLVNGVITTYKDQGYDLTLRQIYYQMVSRGYIANNDKEYKKLGETLNNARLSGLIDWFSIEDRTRNLKGNGHWTSPGSIIKACADQYEIDKWSDQEYHIEVWVEKDALVGVVGTACSPLDVSYFSCRGYVSQSEMWVAARRLMNKSAEDNKKCLILHLGDHDPSGIDMSRDIEDRIRMFWQYHYFEDEVPDPFDHFELKRIALNWDQVQQYNPPPNPAKLSDARCDSYRSRFGDKCWELDALEPTVIGQLITDHVEDHRDEDKWKDKVAEQTEARNFLKKVSLNWQVVTTFLSGTPNVTGPNIEEVIVETDFTIDFNVSDSDFGDDVRREVASQKMHLAVNKALGRARLYHFEDGAATDTNKFIVEEGDLGMFYVTIYQKVPGLMAVIEDVLEDEGFEFVTIEGIPEDW